MPTTRATRFLDASALFGARVSIMHMRISGAKKSLAMVRF
jgi:hypothetical protein